MHHPLRKKGAKRFTNYPFKKETAKIPFVAFAQGLHLYGVRLCDCRGCAWVPGLHVGACGCRGYVRVPHVLKRCEPRIKSRARRMKREFPLIPRWPLKMRCLQRFWQFLSRVFGSKGGCVEGSEANFVYSVIEELGGGKIRGGKMIN